MAVHRSNSTLTPVFFSRSTRRRPMLPLRLEAYPWPLYLFVRVAVRHTNWGRDGLSSAQSIYFLGRPWEFLPRSSQDPHPHKRRTESAYPTRTYRYQWVPGFPRDRGSPGLFAPSATSLIGCRSSTRARAAVLAAWIKGRFKEGLPDTAPATDLQFWLPGTVELFQRVTGPDTIFFSFFSPRPLTYIIVHSFPARDTYFCTTDILYIVSVIHIWSLCVGHPRPDYYSYLYLCIYFPFCVSHSFLGKPGGLQLKVGGVTHEIDVLLVKLSLTLFS